MRMRFSCLLLILAVLASVSGCKTSQKNMYEAYRIAKEANDIRDDDSTIYTSIRREMRHTDMVLAGDTLPVSIQFVVPTPDGGGIPESLKRYNVVAGRFKQNFNARSMRQRLVDSGYPGAFVVQTREPFYFVVAASFTDVNQAVDLLRTLQTTPPFTLISPCPFLLEPSQLR